MEARLTPAALGTADAGRGRALFNQACASCHALYGHGGAIGPDLTGAGRENLDYLLENIVDPSATVTADFRMVVAALADGRVLNGIVRAKTDRTLTLQTQADALVLERREIERLDPSPASLMPEGLLGPLSEHSGTRPVRVSHEPRPGPLAGRKVGRVRGYPGAGFLAPVGRHHVAWGVSPRTVIPRARARAPKGRHPESVMPAGLADVAPAGLGAIPGVSAVLGLTPQAT